MVCHSQLATARTRSCREVVFYREVVSSQGELKGISRIMHIMSNNLLSYALLMTCRLHWLGEHLIGGLGTSHSFFVFCFLHCGLA